MSTYAISDIHGNLDVLKRLLELIYFRYDGQDKLILLGDYVDWGPRSINTLLYVMELCKKYYFVTALLGNHDLMFLDQIKEYFQETGYLDDNWLYNNGGNKTWSEFLELDKEKQIEIMEFLDNLPYKTTTFTNNKKYLLAHACPSEDFVYDDSLTKEENDYKLYDLKYNAVWTRILRMVPNVIQYFDKNNEFENFVCGHTISKYIKEEHFNIRIVEDSYINIDCGAKLLGHKYYEEEDYARLACLRLDDLKEFYIR